MATIEFRGTKREARQAVYDVVGVLTGKLPEHSRIRESFCSTLAHLAYTDIEEAYNIKANGGTDAMGIKWPPLKRTSKKRIAAKQSKRAQQRLASAYQAIKKIRETIRQREFEKVFRRFLVSLIREDAEKRALQVAQRRADRAIRDQDLVSEVEILIETEQLLNSVSAGELSGGSYSPPSSSGGENQKVICDLGSLTLRTEDKKATFHQRGTVKMPARKFFPDDQHPVPSVWWMRWIPQLGSGVLRSVDSMIRRQ